MSTQETNEQLVPDDLAPRDARLSGPRARLPDLLAQDRGEDASAYLKGTATPYQDSPRDAEQSLGTWVSSSGEFPESKLD
ncbi:MAG: hypothetical protein ACJAZ8_001405 [Planctomycetota bacterium]|jgi:hypothetical protein